MHFTGGMRWVRNVQMIETSHLELNMASTPHHGLSPRDHGILPQALSPPIALPTGYVGPAWLPGTGRMIWWTGRVAIGLRHQAPRRVESNAHSSVWVQEMLLG